MHSAAQQATKVPPGWYPDPMGGNGERYWDGIAWSEHFTRQPQQQPAPAAATMPAAAQFVVVPNNQSVQKVGDGNGLVVAGWVCAILLPLIGLIIGLVIASRNDERGKWVIGVSVLMMVIGYIYMQSLMDEAMQAAAQQGVSGATGAVPPPQ